MDVYYRKLTRHVINADLENSRQFDFIVIYVIVNFEYANFMYR